MPRVPRRHGSRSSADGYAAQYYTGHGAEFAENVRGFDAAERCQLAADSKACARSGVLVPSEHHVGLIHEWVTRQLTTVVGQA